MFGLDRIRVSDRIRLNPYPIHIHSKKSDFIHIHIHYPVNGFFYCFNRIGSGQKSTDTDTFAISNAKAPLNAISSLRMLHTEVLFYCCRLITLPPFSQVISLTSIWRQKTFPICKTREYSKFMKNGKMVISVKIQNFSRSQMTKRTSPLESYSEI